MSRSYCSLDSFIYIVLYVNLLFLLCFSFADISNLFYCFQMIVHPIYIIYVFIFSLWHLLWTVKEDFECSGKYVSLLSNDNKT